MISLIFRRTRLCL